MKVMMESKKLVVMMNSVDEYVITWTTEDAEVVVTFKAEGDDTVSLSKVELFYGYLNFQEFEPVKMKKVLRENMVLKVLALVEKINLIKPLIPQEGIES